MCERKFNFDLLELDAETTKKMLSHGDLEKLTLFRLDILGIDNGVVRSISDVLSIFSSIVAAKSLRVLLLALFVVCSASVVIVVTTIASFDCSLVIASTVVDNSLTLTAVESIVLLVLRLCNNIRPNTIIIELNNMNTAIPKNKQM